MRLCRFHAVVNAALLVCNSHPYARCPGSEMSPGKSVPSQNQVVIAAGSHLFPFRTEKLSPPSPMVLQCNAGE